MPDARIPPEILPPGYVDPLPLLAERHESEAVQLESVESLARLMDAQFKIPGVPIPIGLDFIVGLIPGIGDTISLGVAGYIVMRAAGLGAKKRHLTQMGLNIFIDWLIGLVPVIGDLFDVGWRGNLRNTALLREIVEARWEAELRYAERPLR